MGLLIDDAVVPLVRAAADNGFLIGPVFKPTTSLSSPSIRMEGFKCEHGDESTLSINSIH